MNSFFDFHWFPWTSTRHIYGSTSIKSEWSSRLNPQKLPGSSLHTAQSISHFCEDSIEQKTDSSVFMQYAPFGIPENTLMCSGNWKVRLMCKIIFYVCRLKVYRTLLSYPHANAQITWMKKLVPYLKAQNHKTVWMKFRCAHEFQVLWLTWDFLFVSLCPGVAAKLRLGTPYRKSVFPSI